MAILFVSRGTVSGVQVLLDCLCKRTGVPCLSREDLVKQVSRHGDWATAVVEQLSKATSAYEHFSNIRRPYIVLMRQALLERIRDDNVVYHGFSGHLLVPRLSHFVRIRIDAPLSLRVPLTMGRLNCDEEHAREYIRDSDDRQVRWARFMYGRDIRDPGLYDLNINLGHLTTEALCSVLERLLLEKELRASAELKDQVELLFLAANVEAALVVDPRTRELEIDCRVDHDRTHLNGPYLDDAALKVVIDVARNASCDRELEYCPGYASQHRLEEELGALKLSYAP